MGASVRSHLADMFRLVAARLQALAKARRRLRVEEELHSAASAVTMGWAEAAP